jgi:hypothetical protein
VAPFAKTLVGYLPLAIFAGVMFWRMRTMDKARPLRLRRLWLLPVVFVVLVGFVIASMPPSPLGIACIVLGVAIGAAVGWQRARLMRLHVEGEGDGARVMVRQSRAALLLIMALAGVRTLFRSATGTQMSGAAGTHLSVGALAVTDGLLGFALGMIVAHRLELWRRAKALTSAGSAHV